MKITTSEKIEEESREFFAELEAQRSRSLPRPTGIELLKTFPEVKEIIHLKIHEYEKEIKRDEKNIVGMLRKANKKNPQSVWFIKAVIKHFEIPSLVERERHLLRLKSINQLFYEPVRSKAINFQRKLERARNYPILEVARTRLQLKKSGTRFLALCPFHNEKHPSFVVFPETNTFYCFGCGEHGDVIKLTMGIEGVDFKQAVQILSI
jgi:hypothetical protein